MNAKELTNEELAVILRCMRVTGIAPTEFERECLDVAADRIEMFNQLFTREETDDAERY